MDAEVTLFRREIGRELRKIRLQKGATTVAIAARSGVSRSYLYEVERGTKEASSEVLAAICDALDVFPLVSLHMRKMQLDR